MLTRILKSEARGFTLIELMVSVAILAVLLSVGVPAMSTWTKNAAVAARGETIQNGLRQAYGEAIRRNAPVQFILTDGPATVNGVTSTAKTNGKNWIARVLDAAAFPGTLTVVGFVAGSPAAEVSGSGGSTIEGPASVIFTGSGRLLNNSGNLLSSYQVYRVSNPASTRVMCVFASPGGGVRSCDPAYASGDPRACQPILTATQCRKAGV
ncbi:pilus assembly FimT family protein [Niveibacterium sp. 24ML]|uniref:pilus assembly FimT family protein n=1 Tax=Niveibacterium sp. 24ML TaxID=2985512 RepID=UPI002B4C2129|nr:GspH/FimT family pseudopilin [Niveibacterium sp. 24ML]